MSPARGAAIIARVLVAALQGVTVVFAALFAHFESLAMADDGWAARAEDVDWWLLAGLRSLSGFGVALLVGGLLFAINRAMIYWRLESPTARPLRTASLGALVVVGASAAGALQFAMERPSF